MQQQILKGGQLEIELTNALQSIPYDKLFILTDEQTYQHCLPVILHTRWVGEAVQIKIKSGEIHKNIDSLTTVWKSLSEHGATRKSLMINLGGGMITDLGGFAAATFKRGIRFINIPTTLLAIVDAAVGGKTGINFHGFKNEVGVFAPAEVVLINPVFLKTLDRENLLSGYAEMVKHSLLDSDREWERVISFDLKEIDYEQLTELSVTSVGVKEKIVLEDPTEKGIRKALNLGHTVGHAIESYLLEINKPVLHGYAVAWGLVCELYLSFVKLKFDQEKLTRTIRFIKDNYGIFFFDCRQYERLYELMQHDKKNESDDKINFTLLRGIGDVSINQIASKTEIFESFDFYREYFGC